MLALYRNALRLRRQLAAPGDGELAWVEVGRDTLAFRREPGFTCLVHLGEAPLDVPATALGGGETLLASGPIDPDGRVPTDTTVWYARR
jgi:alpha-glucosidase